MAHNLADEMLQSILAPPLRVPDAMFQDVGLVSPFSKVEQSASDVLLVCKRWMRVATPTLYHTVVIRSNAQAAALNAALTRNPDFGRHVRRFRLERPYPEYLNKTVTNTMPNIVDLCLPIGVLAADRPSDVYELLSISQPQHLLLVNYRPNHSNATFNKLVSKICAAIQSWTGLVSTCMRSCTNTKAYSCYSLADGCHLQLGHSTRNSSEAQFNLRGNHDFATPFCPPRWYLASARDVPACAHFAGQTHVQVPHALVHFSSYLLFRGSEASMARRTVYESSRAHGVARRFRRHLIPDSN